LNHLGKIASGIRMPLTPLSQPLQSMVSKAIEKTEWNFAEQASTQLNAAG
jgi:hypothetical protein